MADDFGMGYALGADSGNRNNNDMFGGGSWWINALFTPDASASCRMDTPAKPFSANIFVPAVSNFSFASCGVLSSATLPPPYFPAFTRF